MQSNNDFHVLKLNGDKILTLLSGENYILKDLAFEILKLKDLSLEDIYKDLEGRYKKEAIKKAYMEMKKVLSNPPKDHRFTKMPRKLRALCLNITHKCNLSCTYCFAKDLTDAQAKTMPIEVIKSAFDFLCRESEGVRRLQVDFFGGEPLIAFDRVKEGVKYARSLESKYNKEFLFTLTTNGVLLDDKVIDFLKAENISLILSLDGPKEYHDRFRPFPSGKGSYDIIYKKIKRAQERLEPKDYYIRGTFTSQTLDILKILSYYQREGFYNVSLEPVSAPANLPYALKEKDLILLKEQYKETARWLLDKDMRFYHFILELDNPLCLTRRITGCGAGVEYLAVDPQGDLYPCHQFVEDKDYYMGNVFEGKISLELKKYFKNSTLYTKEGCDSCWARFYCSGGCHFQHLKQNNNIDVPSKFYCDLFRSRLESALWYNIKRRNSVSFVKS